MSYQRLSVDVDTIDGTDVNDLIFEDLGSVHVSLAGEARCNGDEESGAERRCTACGLALDGDGKDFQNIPGTYCEDRDCEECEGTGAVPDDGSDCEAPDCTEGHLPHEPEPVPLSWANSAAILLDESADTIAVRISVGDPRGAFVMSVERVRWTDDEGNARDEMRLSVPTPEDGMGHMPLTPLASPGYFRIGA